MSNPKININSSIVLNYFALTIVMVAIVCLCKYLILNVVLSGAEEYNNPVFSLTKIINTGAAFSLLTSHTQLLIYVSVFVVLGITSWVVYYSPSISKAEVFAVALLMSGVVINLYERITLGYVIDYIKLNFISFPIFNFSDIAIVSGAIIYIFILFSKKE